MTLTYTICPSCGQKALTVATRCPRCGLAFEAQFFRQTTSGFKSRRIPVGILIAGVVVTLLAANALRRRLDVARSIPPAPPAPTVSVPSVAPHPQPQKASAVKEPVTTTVSLPKPVTESLPAAPEVAQRAAPEPDEDVPGQRRYASTWMNVRADPSNKAPVLRILRPGESVHVDILEQGWYRVVSDGEPAGYVDRRFLDADPPATP
jgi:Bacterial SH3 domain